ncbi:MAG: hypothetical protein R3D67_17320 [Hyphomicrobiaceae bacterium]
MIRRGLAPASRAERPAPPEGTEIVDVEVVFRFGRSGVLERSGKTDARAMDHRIDTPFARQNF